MSKMSPHVLKLGEQTFNARSNTFMSPKLTLQSQKMASEQPTQLGSKKMLKTGSLSSMGRQLPLIDYLSSVKLDRSSADFKTNASVDGPRDQQQNIAKVKLANVLNKQAAKVKTSLPTRAQSLADNKAQKANETLLTRSKQSDYNQMPFQSAH